MTDEQVNAYNENETISKGLTPQQKQKILSIGGKEVSTYMKNHGLKNIDEIDYDNFMHQRRNEK